MQTNKQMGRHAERQTDTAIEVPLGCDLGVA